MVIGKSVRSKHRMMLTALVISVLCVSCAQRAVAANTTGTPVRIQSAAAYAEGFGNTLKVSNRSSQGYLTGHGRSTSASGHHQSRGKKGRSKNRSSIRRGDQFFGFGNGYIGLDGTSLSIEDSTGDDFNPRGLRLRLGTPIDNVFDLELHFGGGRESEFATADKFSATYLGAFVKGHLPVGSRSAVFGLAGFSGVGIKQRIGTNDFSDSRGGFSYGFGLETSLSNRINLSGDFVRYVGDDGEFAAVSAVNLGIKIYF